MMRQLVAAIVLAVVWGTATGQARMQPALDVATLKQALGAPTLQAAQQRIVALTRAQTFDVKRIEALLGDPRVAAVGREHLRLTLLTTARERDAPTPALEAYVRHLTTHEDEVLVWHEEGPLAIPYFAIASAAEGTLALWQRRRAAAELVEAFARGETPDLSDYFLGDARDASARRAGAIDALRTLAPHRLATLTSALLARSQGAPMLEEPLALIARETADRTLFEHLVSTGRSRAVLPLLRDASEALAPTDAFAVLTRAHANARYRSAALYALAPLLDRTPGVRHYLVETLADSASGATAAAVIAASADRPLLDAVAARLSDPTLSDRHRARLVLTLRLADDTASRQQLRAALASGHLTPDHLAEEVRAWLGE